METLLSFFFSYFSLLEMLMEKFEGKLNRMGTLEIGGRPIIDLQHYSYLYHTWREYNNGDYGIQVMDLCRRQIRSGFLFFILCVCCTLSLVAIKF